MKEVAEVVFLGIKPYSESSLWVRFFSEKHGLQNGIIKGGKKKKIKPFVLGLYHVSFYRWSDSGLQNIVDLERSRSLEGTYNSPVKILIAFFVAESLKSFLNNEVVDQSFFAFIKSSIIDLNKEVKVKAFPVLFLARLIHYSGHQPLKTEGGGLLKFDIKTGVFDPQEASNDCVDDPLLVASIYDLFYNAGKNLDGRENRIFNILLSYCAYHIPSYESRQSVEIIRETLYD
ncbi:MAG: DNA repair protein RecO [Crocinitomicaceae bacterium]